MAATTSKPEMPAFSYAQAAKGLSTVATSQQSAKSSTEQTGIISHREESNNSPAADESANSSSTLTEVPVEKGELGADSESKSATTASSKNVVSGTSSPSFGTASTSTLPKEDDISVIPNGTSDSTWDKQSQASVPLEKPNAAGEAKKEETSNSSSEKSVPVKELKAAPIPAVNVWQQRKEAQEAKAKANAAALKSAAANAAKLAPVKPATVGQQASGDIQDAAKPGSKKKAADGQTDPTVSQGKDRRRADTAKSREDGSRKSGGRSTRPNEESTESTLPPVADAAAWPTPQTAQGEEKKKAQEKTEKSEKSPVLRAHGKEKWTPVPYVPSAVFTTPLPTGARRGGRPSRGGREGGRGGAHNTSAHNGPDNKAAPASGQAAPVPATKQTALPDRGRNESIPARANSLPAQARRPASVDTGAQTEQRRPSQAPDRSRGDIRAKAAEETHAPTNGPQATAGDAVKSHREPRYSGKNQESAPVHKGADHNSRLGNVPADGHNGSRFSSHERRFDTAPRSADLARESTNWREHRDFTRDRGEYQRDREHPRERGDSRPERGRGGYRGRGGHSYAGGSQNAHFSNSQLSQNSYIPPKSFQRSQQQGFPNGTQPHNSAHRLSLRSPSLPTSAGLYGAYPLPDISTMYAYQPMHPGPMTAIPYQPYMEPFSLIGMIQMQLEYYFSVDNLCKDLFLRKHMDSQGFVMLNFIANFKRIRNLTEDFDLLRHCSRQLRNAEYQFGEDGIDRLRPREKWEQWVLTVEQRDPSAQTDGPPPAKTYSFADDLAVPLPNGSVQDVSQTSANAMPNGTAEHNVPRTSLSSMAPEFTPFVPVGVQNESANVGKPNHYNVFPDDQVENLVIVVRKPGSCSPSPQYLLSHPPRALSNRSVDGSKTAGSSVTSDDNPIAPTNGETSASSLSAEGNKLRQNNDLPKSLRKGNGFSEPRSRVPAFWIKEKDSPVELTSSGIVHVFYNNFRKRALEKHDSTAADDGEYEMDVLYLFWSHFLVNNFNAKMYDEFKNLALDGHGKSGVAVGFNSLVQFYESMLLNSTVVPDEVANDLVGLVETEPRTCGRPLFYKLRSAWRNGAFNLNSRKKIDQIISKDLKAELES